MLKVEHIGIAVKNMQDAVLLYEKLLNTNCYKTELVETEKVNTAFFQQGETKIELLESTDPNEMERLKFQGFQLLNEEPKPGADNKLVCFLHPKGTSGVLVELCQSI